IWKVKTYGISHDYMLTVLLGFGCMLLRDCLKKRRNNMNLTKILSNDELRPAMMRAVIINGYIYATNGHAGIRIKLSTVPNFHVNTDNKVLNKFQLGIISKAKEVWFEDDFFKVKGNTVN